MKFHGFLKNITPEMTVEASTPAEAIQAWSQQFRKQLKGKPTIKVREVSNEIEAFAPLQVNELNVEPFTEGAGGGSGGGFLKIAIGAVFMVTGWGIAASYTLLGPALFSTGVALATGGLIELLSPAPKLDMNFNSTADNERSRYLGTPKNTVKIGTPIAIGWGLFKVNGHYLSYNIDAKTVFE